MASAEEVDEAYRAAARHQADWAANGDQMLEAFTPLKWISVQHGRSAFPF